MKDKLIRALRVILSSKENRLDIRNIRYLPRWSVLGIDVFLLVCSIVLTVVILRDLHINHLRLLTAPQQVLLVLGVNIGFMLVYKTYAGLIRHSSFMDALKMVLASTSTFGVLLFINISVWAVIGEKIFLTSALVVYTLFSFTFLFLFRLAIKQLYEYFKFYQTSTKSENALIVGIDENAISVAAALDIEHPQRFKIKGFVSAESSNKRLLILGKPVVKVKDKDKVHPKRATAISYPKSRLRTAFRQKRSRNAID